MQVPEAAHVPPSMKALSDGRSCMDVRIHAFNSCVQENSHKSANSHLALGQAQWSKTKIKYLC